MMWVARPTPERLCGRCAVVTPERLWGRCIEKFGVSPELHFLKYRRAQGAARLRLYSVSRFVVRAYGRVATACCHEVARAIIAPNSQL